MNHALATLANAATPVHAPESFGWSLVLQYGATIDKYSRRLFSRLNPQDYEEARQEFILHIVERAHAFDPAKSAATSWIFFQGRAIQKLMCRRFRKSTRERSGMRLRDDGIDVAPEVSADGAGFAGYRSAWNSNDSVHDLEREADAEAQVAALYAEALPLERTAMLTILHDVPVDELRSRYNLTTSNRREILADLGRCVRSRYVAA